MPDGTAPDRLAGLRSGARRRAAVSGTARCCGSRRRFRSAASPSATGWNGPRRRAGSGIARRCEAWLVDLLDARVDRQRPGPGCARPGARRAAGDDAALREAADLALALQPSAERHLEAVTQGGAFLAQIEASWPCDAVARLQALQDGEIAYCTAAGVAAAGHGIAAAAPCSLPSGWRPSAISCPRPCGSASSARRTASACWRHLFPSIEAAVRARQHGHARRDRRRLLALRPRLAAA